MSSLSYLSNTRVITVSPLPACSQASNACGIVGILIGGGPCRGQTAIASLSLTAPMTAAQLAEVASAMIAEYESAELVAPLARGLPVIRPTVGPSPMTLELAASIVYAGMPAIQRTLDVKA